VNASRPYRGGFAGRAGTLGPWQRDVLTAMADGRTRPRADIAAEVGITRWHAVRVLRRLQDRELVASAGDDRWTITGGGRATAAIIARRNRT